MPNSFQHLKKNDAMISIQNWASVQFAHFRSMTPGMGCGVEEMSQRVRGWCWTGCHTAADSEGSAASWRWSWNCRVRAERRTRRALEKGKSASCNYQQAIKQGGKLFPDSTAKHLYLKDLGLISSFLSLQDTPVISFQIQPHRSSSHPSQQVILINEVLWGLFRTRGWLTHRQVSPA